MVSRLNCNRNYSRNRACNRSHNLLDDSRSPKVCSQMEKALLSFLLFVNQSPD